MNMFRFANIEFLWGLLLIPAFILLFAFFWQWRKNAIGKLGDKSLVLRLMPDVSTGKMISRLVLFCLAFGFIVIGLANPQIGSKMEEVKREGVDLIIALDISNSMKAEDLTPNRLEKAKQAISRLLNQLHNDRIGIIVFAGKAYVQLPITTDYAAAKLFLNNVDTDLIPAQGTNIGEAIDLAMESFDFKNGSSKSIIVITDGENHESDATKAAENAAEKDVTVHAIGMGSVAGAPIPVYRGTRQVGFRKDKDGNSIVTKLNENMLKEIVAEGGGIYVRASNAQTGLDIVLEEIGKMQKTEFGSKIYTDYEDRFQYFIGLALILIMLEFILSNRKSRWLEKIKLFEQ